MDNEGEGRGNKGGVLGLDSEQVIKMDFKKVQILMKIPPCVIKKKYFGTSIV